MYDLGVRAPWGTGLCCAVVEVVFELLEEGEVFFAGEGGVLLGGGFFCGGGSGGGGEGFLA